MESKAWNKSPDPPQSRRRVPNRWVVEFDTLRHAKSQFTQSTDGAIESEDHAATRYWNLIEAKARLALLLPVRSTGQRG